MTMTMEDFVKSVHEKVTEVLKWNQENLMQDEKWNQAFQSMLSSEFDEYIANDPESDIKIGILTPDVMRKAGALDKIIKIHPDVFNHNIETTRNVFKTARPLGDYETSLNVLRYIKQNSNKNRRIPPNKRGVESYSHNSISISSLGITILCKKAT